MCCNEHLSDSQTVRNVLTRIGEERKWTGEDLASDLAILAKNRLVHVQDLRSLSRESWAQIELLPLVKDLLRAAIDPNWLINDNSTDLKPKGVVENNDDGGEGQKEEESEQEENSSEDDKKKDKKDKKKDKEKKKDKKNKKKSLKGLGTPVVPMILTKPSALAPITTTQQFDEDASHIDLGEQDPLTIQNTIRNGFNHSLLDDDDDYILSPTTGIRRKSVTFSNQTAIGVAASEKNDVKEKKKEKEKKKKKDMASNKYNGFTKNHPYTSHPIVKFRKMKLKQCNRLPPVPANDHFLQSIHDKLLLANKHIVN